MGIMNNCESVSRESIDSELIDSELIDSELINSELMNDKSDNNNPDIILSSENDKKNLNSKLIENCIKVKILKQNITENANPKKRGRKPKEKTAEDLKPKVLKKRGRKPKEKTAEELIPREPRKRGRKPKDKYGAFSNNNISENKVEINN